MCSWGTTEGPVSLSAGLTSAHHPHNPTPLQPPRPQQARGGGASAPLPTLGGLLPPRLRCLQGSSHPGQRSQLSPRHLPLASRVRDLSSPTGRRGGVPYRTRQALRSAWTPSPVPSLALGMCHLDLGLQTQTLGRDPLARNQKPPRKGTCGASGSPGGGGPETCPWSCPHPPFPSAETEEGSVLQALGRGGRGGQVLSQALPSRGQGAGGRPPHRWRPR